MSEPAVYEVDLTKKYVLQFDFRPTPAEQEMIAVRINEWVRSDAPFLLLPPGVKLVKVNVDEVDDE